MLTSKGREGKQAPTNGVGSNAPKQNCFSTLQTRGEQESSPDVVTFTLVDLLELDITRVVKFQFLNEPILEWTRGNSMPKGQFASYLKARKMISKGCFYHLVRVRDVDSETPSLESVPIFNEISEVFRNDLPSIPPTREREFGIDLLPDMFGQLLQKSFQELKDRLTFAPVLTLPQGTNGFVVYYDASRIGLGCVLMQNGKVIAYASRLDRLGVQLVDSTKGGVMVHNGSEFSFVVDVKAKQGLDLILVDDLREYILTEAYSLRYSILPGATKMYPDLREVEHQKQEGVSKDVSIPTWKWEDMNMDFIVGLPRIWRQHDSIWVIVDWMTKLAYFILVKVSITAKDYPKLYLG
ncbi:hypothetical protein KY285_035973 [Solanum tuberosum]|nr:hypothetical protein KY289_036133 [Solanum tuberosum]KAH0639387.1 hypothetical protein KY285_035973 [Solanum tuberosum]